MASDRTDGFRVLDEFVCDAISDVPAPPTGRWGRGVNPGAPIVSEPFATLPAERIAELRQMNNSELLRLVRQSGPRLGGVELLAIHEIAAERSDAIDLSRETMRLAISRRA